MLELLKQYKGNNRKDLFNIYAKDIRYVRLFPLLSMIFLKKVSFYMNVLCVINLSLIKI